MGLATTALAAGAGLRLGWVAHARPIEFTLFRWVSPADLSVAVRLDLTSVVLLVAIALLALAWTDRAESRGTLGNGLLAAGFAALVVEAGSLAWIVYPWTALIVLAVLRGVGRGSSILARRWLILLLACGPAAFLGAGAASSVTSTFLAPSVGLLVPLAEVVFVAVGAATAGVILTDDPSSIDAESDEQTFLTEAIFPLVGFSLAAHAIALAPDRLPGSALVTLAVVGVLGAVAAIREATEATDLRRVSRSVGKGECAIGFAGLALGPMGMIVAAFLVATGCLARTAVARRGSMWPTLLGWASSAGLPPTPGFGARWLILGIALSTGHALVGLYTLVLSALLTLVAFSDALTLRQEQSLNDPRGGPVAPRQPRTVAGESRSPSSMLSEATDELPFRGRRGLGTSAGVFAAVGLTAVIIATGLVSRPGILSLLLFPMPLATSALRALKPGVVVVALVLLLIAPLVGALFARPDRHSRRLRAERGIAKDGVVSVIAAVAQLAGQCADLTAVLEARYGIVVGISIVVVAFFGLVR